MAKPIPLFTQEAKIKRALRKHLKGIGFHKGESGMLIAADSSKDAIRKMHESQRRDRLNRESVFIEREWNNLSIYFANGSDVIPEEISPSIEVVRSGTWQSDLFRLASLTWSVPVSQGFGRRIRFLVWDRSNCKLMGLIAIGDPVFNLNARDSSIGWNSNDRRERLACVMDAYVLGAVPPYNFLLVGKMLASMLSSLEIKDIFFEKYGKSKGLISGKEKRPRLAAITTTSSLGRSSVYNRVKLDSKLILEPLGYTKGWGHFHVSDKLFLLIREYLDARDDKYSNNNRFGDGPNWKLRSIRHALTLLGLNPNILRHSIKREVFICKIASNAYKYLRGESRRLIYPKLLSIPEIAHLSKNRWVIPRAARRPDYQVWDKRNIINTINSFTTELKIRKQEA